MLERKNFLQEPFSHLLTYIKSDTYQEKLSKKNLPSDYLAEVKKICSLSDLELTERADLLLAQAKTALREYKISGDFLIPYSGGRDSTLITYLVRKTFPKLTVHAATVLTGFSSYQEDTYTPRDHAERVLDRFGLNGKTPQFQHHYIDLSSLMNDFVISTAEDDYNQLGYPGICSGCKIIIEAAMAQLAVDLNAPNAPYGYVKYQAEQQWPEQTVVYRETMNELLAQDYPQVNFGSPFWEVMEYPTDSLLMMARLGISLAEQKGEVSCAAGGLNPISIDSEKLSSFVRKKMSLLPKTFEIKIHRESPIYAPTLIREVSQLKSDSDFTDGVFKE